MDQQQQPVQTPAAPTVAQRLSPQALGAREQQLNATEAQHEQQSNAEQTAAMGALQSAEGAPMPAQREIPLPQRPAKSPVDPKELDQFTTGLMAIAMLSIARGNQDRWVNTLQSLNGAMRGYIEGNQQKAKTAYEQYDRQFKEAMQMQNQADREYQKALTNRQQSINQMSRNVSMLSAKWGHVSMQDAAQRRSFDSMVRTAEQMQTANERLQQQHEALAARIQAHNDAMNSHWQVMQNPSTGELVRVNPNTGEVQPFSGATKGFGKPGAGGGAGGGMGSRAEVFFNRITSAGNEAAQAAANIMELPINATMFDPGSSSGIFDAGRKALTRELTTQEIQDYNVMIAGVTRNLAAIEASGLAPSGALTGQMGAVEFHPGDSQFTKLRRMAEMRQIVEKGLEPYLSNPKVPEEQKGLIRNIDSTMQQAIPFTQHDLTQFEMQQRGKNQHMTLRQYMEKNGIGGTPLPDGKSAGTVDKPPLPAGWKIETLGPKQSPQEYSGKVRSQVPGGFAPITQDEFEGKRP